MCWLISEVKLAGWLLRGMAKTLPFPADTEGTSTSKKKKKRAKQKEKVISLLEVKGPKQDVSIDTKTMNHLILMSCVLIFQMQEQFTVAF